MAEMEKRPWRFTIEFDDEKAKRNGYNVDDLYDCVDGQRAHRSWYLAGKEPQGAVRGAVPCLRDSIQTALGDAEH